MFRRYNLSLGLHGYIGLDFGRVIARDIFLLPYLQRRTKA